MTNLSTGGSLRQRFPADLKLEELAVERRAMSYLYEAADQCWFINTQDFEQIGLPAAIIGKRTPFLHEGMTLSVEFIDGRPVSVAFQDAVDARIESTFPVDHYQSNYKRAILENGVEVTVPLFIKSGDTVRLDLGLLTCISPRKPGTSESDAVPHRTFRKPSYRLWVSLKSLQLERRPEVQRAAAGVRQGCEPGERPADRRDDGSGVAQERQSS